MIARLDVLTGFAHVAENCPTEEYCRPRMVDSVGETRTFELTASRHPLLELQNGVNFIANDVKLTSGSSHYQIITGPNMGGKSTYITTIGICALLAQIGSFVPATTATIPIFDSILCRVGAGDQQLKGISTFMAEMLESTAIVNQSTLKSLVIIDELGRGTSTSEGLGLAQAISEHMATKNTFCLFATHFHELCQLSGSIKGVVNKSVDVHVTDTKISMGYKIKNEPCEKSYGIHVAQQADFPGPVIACAKRKVKELESHGGSQTSNNSTGLDMTDEKQMLAFINEFKTLKPKGGDENYDGLNELWFQVEGSGLLQKVGVA